MVAHAMSTTAAPPPPPPSSSHAPNVAARPRVAAVRRWSLKATDVYLFVVANVVLMTAMWVRHGGADTSFGGVLTGIGQLTGLYAQFAILAQLLLMSRSPWLEQLAGRERLVVWHRWVGFSSVALLAAHTVTITLGYAAQNHSSVGSQSWDLLRNYPDILMATVGLGLFFLVAATSVRALRSRLRYETWFAIHLYAYLALALGFAHQFATGGDFITDRSARLYWAGLMVCAIGSLVVFRFGQPLWYSYRHRLRIAEVFRESDGVVSILISGDDLHRLAAAPGQFFVWRFLTRDRWWRAHPFSLSAVPDGRRLRITVKAVGDDTNDLQRLRRGVRVIAEGPYGHLTSSLRRRRKILLIAGGVGITPLRALFEEFVTARSDVVLLYRARKWDDVLFRTELDEMAKSRDAIVHYKVGRRGSKAMPIDPLRAEELARLVPDVRQRDVFLCGPPEMAATTRRSLRRLGVADDQIHSEAFAY